MQSVLQSLSQYAPQVMLVLAAATLLLLGLLLQTRRQLGTVRSRWRTLLEGTGGENIERLLDDHLGERVALESRVRDAEERLHTLENKMRTSKRHLGIVRYDAFDDVGGEQSFALAFYDDHGNGAVFNGIIGRTDCRVYCKPLVAGRSDRNLGQEETRAIEEAVRSTPKSVLTP